MSDRKVEKQYVSAGAKLGDALSYSYLGIPVGLSILIDIWEEWETEYSKRGYRTVSLDSFINYGGGYTKNLNGIGIKREEGEELISHVARYRRLYPGELRSVISVKKVTKRSFMGRYTLPSTEEKG